MGSPRSSASSQGRSKASSSIRRSITNTKNGSKAGMQPIEEVVEGPPSKG